MTSVRPKTHREFFRIALDAAATGTARWTPVPGSDGLITEPFACRPPHVLHGPFTSRGGCMLLEFQYYD
jgi:hypothetical protein